LSAEYPDAGGAVLAGGNASRFDGVNKAFVKLDGIPLIKHILNTMRQLFDEILIVTNSPEEFTCFEKEFITSKKRKNAIFRDTLVGQT